MWFALLARHSTNRRLRCPWFSNNTRVLAPKIAVNSSDSDVTGDTLWWVAAIFLHISVKIFTPLTQFHNWKLNGMPYLLKNLMIINIAFVLWGCPLSYCTSFWPLVTEALVPVQGSTHLGWGCRSHMYVSSVCIKL